MPYARPTVAEFQAVYADFASVTQPQFDYWVAQAERVADARFGDDQLHGVMLLTAHNLASQGIGSSVEAQRGGASQIKSGTIALLWDDSMRASSAYASTRYGREFYPLLRAYTGGPLATATGVEIYPVEGYPRGFV